MFADLAEVASPQQHPTEPCNVIRCEFVWINDESEWESKVVVSSVFIFISCPKGLKVSALTGEGKAVTKANSSHLLYITSYLLCSIRQKTTLII